MGAVSGAMGQAIQNAIPTQGGAQQPPIQPTAPAQREGLGQMFPNYTFPRGPSNQPTPRPQVQPPMPPQGGKGGVYQPMPGQVPPQGGKGNMPLPEGYQSPYANYGFDPGLQSYLDQQNYRSNFDAGVGYQYDPTNQTFTGGTMSGRYNPIPLNVMQQAAGGNRDVLSPYFQSKYPQPTGPAPTVKPGTFNPFNRPGQPTPLPAQRPQRGPVDRNIQPITTQGLAGLLNIR